jgi:hypothetical protein
MPYICLDENEVIQNGDKVVYEDNFEFDVTGLSGEKPKDFHEWHEGYKSRIVAVLRRQDPKTRCLSEEEQVCADDTFVYYNGYLIVRPDGNFPGQILRNVLGWESGILIAVLRSTENSQ